MSRVVYTTLAQVTAKLPMDFIVQALDDDRDGAIDTAVWEAVVEGAADDVDGKLGMRYATPFDPSALPAIVKSSSLLFVLETLYQRRGFGAEETNPFLVPARAARKDLTEIGNGEKPLTPQAERPRASVAVITEPASTHSAAGNRLH